MRRILGIQNIFLIFYFSNGCFFQSVEVPEQDIAKPLFEVIGSTKIISPDYSDNEEYIQYDLVVTQIEDSIFYFSPSEGSELYYPFGFEYIKLNEDKTTARTNVLAERTDTVKAIILPGKKKHLHFKTPNVEISFDTLIFRFLYFTHSDPHTGKVAEAILLRD